MNFLRKKLDDLKRPFGKGQKWERYAPAVNAFDTFLFVPNHTTHSGAHIRDAVDVLAACATWHTPSSRGNHNVTSCIGTDSISCISFALLLA